MREAIGVGVIGTGFMGATHVASYAAAAADGICELVALCDRSAGAAAAEKRGNLRTVAEGATGFDLASVPVYTSAEELLADRRIQAVSICTPTDTHADLAIAALRAGKHVLIEKPVAVHAADIRRIAEAASSAGRVCMPAMCMRYWPGWDWLRDRVRDGSLGAVRSAVFTRLGCRPDWSDAFYKDPDRTGGALNDLHVHDADVIRWLFGDPETVVSTGSLDHVTTLYRFRDGPAHVVAEGGWDHTPGFPFVIRYTVAFERATASFDLAREERVRIAIDGRWEHVPLPDANAYEREVREFLNAIREGRAPTTTLEDAIGAAELLEAERRSLQSGRPERVRA